jgi:hypothetical protein
MAPRTRGPKDRAVPSGKPERYQVIAYLNYAMKDVAALNEQSAYLLKIAIEILELEDLTIVPVEGQ